MLLVTYGTLKRGYGNHRILKNSKFISECFVRGYQLFDSGFPVAAPSIYDTIKGELFDIGDPLEEPEATITLNRLDGLEGFRGLDNPSSMYFRKTIVAYTEDGSFDADIYEGNPLFWNNFISMRVERQDEAGTYYWDR